MGRFLSVEEFIKLPHVIVKFEYKIHAKRQPLMEELGKCYNEYLCVYMTRVVFSRSCFSQKKNNAFLTHTNTNVNIIIIQNVNDNINIQLG